MREERGRVRVDLLFGKTMGEAVQDGIRRHAVSEEIGWTSANNPQPTGDHWKPIGWVTDYMKRGDESLRRVTVLRRDFIKRCAEMLKSGGAFCMEISSMTARRFRDDHNLRMQRGKVYALVSLLPEPVIIEEQRGSVKQAGDPASAMHDETIAVQTARIV